MATDIAGTIRDVRSRIASGDLPADSRRALLQDVKELQYELETPRETCIRYRYSVCALLDFSFSTYCIRKIMLTKGLATQGLDLTISYIFYQIRLFDVLVKRAKSPISTDDLANETNTDPILLGRLLRYAASSGFVKQSSEDTWTASRATHSLVIPSSEANIEQAFIDGLPLYVDLPRFLVQNSYQNPTDSRNTVHSLTYNTPLDHFDWMKGNPEHYAALNKYMAANRMTKTGINAFPFEEKVPSLFESESPETALFVDVGGGRGQMCRAFRAKHPDLPGRVILQDLQLIIAEAPSVDGIEAMAHDFFHQQPIQGAKIYFLRHVLHDWPDAKAEAILKRLVEAMDKDSVILIDEKVLPDVGASNSAAGLDLLMMCTFAASERSERAWKGLLGKVGLKVEYSVRYNEEEGDVIMMVLPEE
ncbi:MAG: hypothetical protein L6R38_009566 [Xanthoria sp. 2 TBL-2021]|nr:MAG: hypothetical protein L6R38_009566 [Xanthoria sp. 2 TBL-2021]